MAIEYIPIREKLLAGTVTLGSWIMTGNEAAAEILANAGYEWLGIDGEHTSIETDKIERLCRATHGRGPAMLVRVRECDTLAIRRALDCGAEGVIVPLVNNADQAREAVAAAKFPPAGVRGYAFCRASNWGDDFDEFARHTNDHITVVVMIESKEAIENIDDILAVEGVDGTFVGPYDLSGSYGIPGQLQHPTVIEARRRVLDACAGAGKAAGLHIARSTPESVEQTIDEGFTFICLGMDTVFLSTTARNTLAAARACLESRS